MVNGLQEVESFLGTMAQVKKLSISSELSPGPMTWIEVLPCGSVVKYPFESLVRRYTRSFSSWGLERGWEDFGGIG